MRASLSTRAGVIARIFVKLTVGLLFLAPMTRGSASAESAQEFFRGKTLTLIVSSSGGGGYDLLGRLVARHIGDHLPVNGAVIVRNMPGAGGIVATNYLYNAAPQDGATIGLVQNNVPFEPLMNTQQAHYDPSRLNWLGTPSVETGVLAVWKTAAAKTLEDIQNHSITVGAPGAHSTPSFYARLLNATLGAKLKVIVGYPGDAETYLAMQRGEVDGYLFFFDSLMALHPTAIRDGVLRPIVQYGAIKQPALGETPFASDVIRSPDKKALLKAGFAGISAGRPFVAPPGVPAGRVAALRAALMATFKDPKFLTEANAAGVGVDQPRTGAQLAAFISDTYKTPQPVVEELRKLYGQ